MELTIKGLYDMGRVSNYTYNVCLANEIKTFEALLMYYVEHEGFKNLKFSNEDTEAQLMKLYHIYKDDYTEVIEVLERYKSKQNEDVLPVKKEKAKKVPLQNLVTDLDMVFLTTAANISKKRRKKEEDLVNEKRYDMDKIAEVRTKVKPSTVVDLKDVKEAIIKHNLLLQQRAEKKLKLKQKMKEGIKQGIKGYTKVKVSTTPPFVRHPSEKLNELYAKKAYRGANPEDARVIFVGRDANYAEDIEQEPVFEALTEYLTDEVAYWKKYGVYHPYLLHNYKGERSWVSKSFSKLNLDSSLAGEISFVDLIGFPTLGRVASYLKRFGYLLLSDDNRKHLVSLDKLLNRRDKKVFVALDLIDVFKLLYEETGLFKRFAMLEGSEMREDRLYRHENIFIHRKFSSWLRANALMEMEREVKGNLSDFGN